MLRVTETAASYALWVRVPRGSSAAHLEKAAETAAAAMGLAGLRVTRDRANAALCTVAVVQRDPLAATEPLPWPLADAAAFSLWEPIGVDEDGRQVTLRLPERNVLLGGEPGAGKSAALSLLVAAAALDPGVKLWLLDGKRVELAAWAPAAERLVGPDVAEAADMLDALRAEMDLRYAQLLAWGRRKVSPDDGLGLHVVVIDELALYLATGERKARDRLAESLRDLIARGRAAGVVVLAATQKPSSDVVPTSVRDLFGFRWALRCATRVASDTILGSGWATEGHSTADIDPALRGVGLLLHEGGQPVRVRAAYLDDPRHRPHRGAGHRPAQRAGTVTGAGIPPEVEEGMLAQVLARAADPAGYEAWAARARAAGWCRHPVRLVGATRRYSADDGELAGTFASDQPPDRVLLKACGQRRATCCPTCSAVYRFDAYQLVAAGLRGGKGMPGERRRPCAPPAPTGTPTTTPPAPTPAARRRRRSASDSGATPAPAGATTATPGSPPPPPPTTPRHAAPPAKNTTPPPPLPLERNRARDRPHPKPRHQAAAQRRRRSHPPRPVPLVHLPGHRTRRPPPPRLHHQRPPTRRSPLRRTPPRRRSPPPPSHRSGGQQQRSQRAQRAQP